MISNNVLPNFIKAVLFAAAASFSLSAFADGHEAKEKIGELKDMSSEAATTQADEITSALTEEATDAEAAAEAVEAEATDKAEALKAEIPEG